MIAHADKKLDKKSKSASNAGSQMQAVGESTFQFVDNRHEAIAQMKLQELAENSPRVSQLRAFQDSANNSTQFSKVAQLQAMADNNSAQQQPIQKKKNNTGLPDNLKTGMENLSGMSLDDVNVHRNSDKPAQLQAHAYAQGTDIHLGPGQEKHLPHEAWHVVQQKQGRVQPTMQMKGMVNVNDDAGLEKEADVMGAKAMQNIDNFQPQVAQMAFLNNDAGLEKEVDVTGANMQLKPHSQNTILKGSSSNSIQLVKQNLEKEKEEEDAVVEQDLESQDWGTLLGQAQEAQGKFSTIFEKLISSTGAMKTTYVKTKKTMVPNPATERGTEVARYSKKDVAYSGVAPLKGKERAKQKAEEKYKGNYGKILDVVRGTLTYSSFTNMIKGMRIVLENEKLGYKVVRCKQTYKSKDGKKTGSQTLYGDIKMNIQEIGSGHVCEVQFTLKDFIDVKQKGHHSYEEMRTHNPFGDPVLDAMEGKDKETQGHITKAIHGSYAAYTAARIAIEKDASGLAAAIATAKEIQKEINAKAKETKE